MADSRAASSSGNSLTDARRRASEGKRAGSRLLYAMNPGSVAINTAQQSPEAPFGGFKLSGVGRDRGSFAMHAYSELQSIVWPG